MTKNLKLAIDFARRDFKERYVGTSLGKLWYIISPVITLFIYTVIFSDFMKMKLQIIDNTYAYSIYLVPGLLAWTSFSTIVLRLSNSFNEKAHLLKKINVPMYVFQLSIMITELVLFFLSIGLGLLFLLLVSHPITTAFIVMIPVMILQTFFAFGIGVIVSLFIPLFKDLKEAIHIFIQLMFWMTPIIYMKEMVYEKYPFIVDFNPVFYFVEIYQNIFLFSKLPSLNSIFVITVLTAFIVLIAAWLYKKLINQIKDIL